MIRIGLRGGIEFTGRTVDTIIRREYGARAFYRDSRNPSSPDLGEILHPSAYEGQGHHVLGTVVWIETIDQDNRITAQKFGK